MHLSDGRHLTVREFGDPHGFCVVYNHGGLLCGLDISPADSVAREMGLRIVAIDRPGVGSSTLTRGQNTADWASDVEEVLGRLKVTEFSALGWSLGGQYALSLAAKARSVVVVAGALPLTPQRLAELNRTDRLLTTLSTARPSAARATFRVMRVAAPIVGRAASVDIGPWMWEGLAQPDGMVEEYRRFARPWGFNLSEVACPVHIWQGQKDSLVLPSWGRVMAAEIPHAHLHEVSGAGHFVAYDRWADVLKGLV